MLGGVILILSLLLQAVAIVLAVRLIRVTGWRTPWLLITGAVLLMAVRRGITSYQVFLGDLPMPPDPAAEAVALVISILMVAGLSRIAPSFRSAQSAETRLREHQHFLQQVLDTEPGTVYIYDLAERRNVFINRHWLRAYGYSAEETQSRDSDLLARIFHPDDLARIAVHHETWRRAGDQDIREIEYRVRTKEGEWRWLRSREARFERDASGQVTQILGIAHDITEQKLAQEALHDRERQLSAVTDNLPGLVSRVDRDLRYLFVNTQYERVFGLPSASIVGRRIPEVIGADAFERFEPYIKRALAGERVTFENWIKTPSGDLHGRATYAPDIGPDGKVQGLFTLVTDVSDRKQAEEAFRESQRTLSTLIRNLPGVVYRCRNDKDWSTEFVSEGMLALTGYAPSAFSDGTIAVGQLIHRDDQERVWNDIQTALRERRPYQLVYRIYTAAGEEKWVWEQGTGIFAQSGELLFLEGFATDITERKRAEETLRSSEARLTALMQSVDGIVWEADAQTFHFTFVSQRAERLLGHPLVRWTEEPTFWADHLHPDDREGAVRYCRRCVLEKRDHQLEYRMLAADGRTVWLRDIVTVVVENDRPAKLRGIMVDITERKLAEEQLRAKEAHIQTLVGNVPGAVYRCGYAPNWTIEFISEPIQTISGYPASDFINDSVRTYVSVIEPDDWPEVERIAKKCLSRHQPYEVQYRIRHADGSQRWVQEKGQGSFDAKGELRWLDGVILDISERKRAEDEANKLITLIENSSDFIGAADLQGRFVYLNKAGRDLLGLDPETAAGTTIPDCIAQEDQALLRDVVLPQIFQEGHWHGELRFRHFQTGRSIPEDCSGFLIKDAVTGKPQLIATVSRDLSERKLAEEALREHSQRLQMLSQRLVQVQEDEARRIGRELHDDLGQILTMLKIKLQTLPRRKNAPSLEEQVADLTVTVDQAIERTRALSADLRPAMLDDLGLAAALRWMLDRQTQQAGLKGTFIAHGVEARLSSELETTCYRVAQEALTNVVRHARAKHVRIELQREERDVHLLVSDDGVGFDAARALSDTANSLGLLGMRERVELMDGRFTIRSAHEKGTVVHAWFSAPPAAPGSPEP